MLRDKDHEICFIKKVMADKGEHYKPEKHVVAHSQKDAAMGTFAQSGKMRAQVFGDLRDLGKFRLPGSSNQDKLP